MQLYETRCALEAAEAGRQQLEDDNKQLTVKREDVQHRLDTCRRDMGHQVGQLVDGSPSPARYLTLHLVRQGYNAKLGYNAKVLIYNSVFP